jgi:anti-anti-sigma factor
MPLPTDRPLLEETPEADRLNVGALEESDVERVRTRLFELAAGRPGQDFLLDLGQLEYVTSTGLALFVALHKRVLAGGGRLRLRNVRAPVYELFSITRLTGLLDVGQMGEGGLPATASL